MILALTALLVISAAGDQSIRKRCPKCLPPRARETLEVVLSSTASLLALIECSGTSSRCAGRSKPGRGANLPMSRRKWSSARRLSGTDWGLQSILPAAYMTFTSSQSTRNSLRVLPCCGLPLAGAFIIGWRHARREKPICDASWLTSSSLLLFSRRLSSSPAISSVEPFSLESSLQTSSPESSSRQILSRPASTSTPTTSWCSMTSTSPRGTAVDNWIFPVQAADNELVVNLVNQPRRCGSGCIVLARGALYGYRSQRLPEGHR